MVSEVLGRDLGVVFSVSPRAGNAPPAPQPFRSNSVLSRAAICSIISRLRIVLWSFLQDFHLPTVSLRLNGNRHVGRPLADVVHFYLDGRFEFGGGFSWLFHCVNVAHLKASFHPRAGTAGCIGWGHLSCGTTLLLAVIHARAARIPPQRYRATTWLADYAAIFFRPRVDSRGPITLSSASNPMSANVSAASLRYVASRSSAVTCATSCCECAILHTAISPNASLTIFSTSNTNTSG